METNTTGDSDTLEIVRPSTLKFQGLSRDVFRIKTVVGQKTHSNIVLTTGTVKPMSLLYETLTFFHTKP